VKLARFLQPEAICLLSYVEYRLNANRSNTIYTYKYLQNMYPKVRSGRGDQERGEKKER
jgi:hypothetical protein